MEEQIKKVSDNSKRPEIKRRNFFYLFGAAAIGAIALTGSPLKLFGSFFKTSSQAANKSSHKNSQITIKQSPYSVPRSRRSVNG